MTEKIYNHRYYASYHKEEGYITGWYDIQELSHTRNVPDEKDLIALTNEEWESRKIVGHGIKDGKLCEMEQVIKVDQQARTYLHEVQDHIKNEYLMINEQVPDDLVEYQKKLKKVISGELTKLPKKPKY